MGIKKTITLNTAFWEFLIKLVIGLIAAVGIPFLLLWLGVRTGYATYADTSEQNAHSIAPVIAITDDFSSVEIPEDIEYLRIDKSFNVIDSSLDDEDYTSALQYARTGSLNPNISKQYLLVTRDNDYVILQYIIGSKYTTGWMNEHLPSPDKLMNIVMIINCVIVCVLVTAMSSRRLKKQLNPLFCATNSILEQDLDFEVGHSYIKEFDCVLESFNDMKTGLQESLEKQWRLQQKQREQIAAIAHDLKTPLTVVQGNTELMYETSLNDVQQKYIDYIKDSSEQMEVYIRTLIDISKMNAGYQIRLEETDIKDWGKRLSDQIESLCKIRDIRSEIMIPNDSHTVMIDRILLERAVMNIVDNAIEHSPDQGTVYVSISVMNDELRIVVEDQGKGFTQEALEHAEEMFYMDDRSRNSKMHFGMGLYITHCIIEQHKGRLELGNSNSTEGGQVSITIPVNINI